MTKQITTKRVPMTFSREEVVQLRDALVHALDLTSDPLRRKQYQALDRAMARTLEYFN